MVVREVFEVLYSPVKAFRKIIEKPDLKGCILVLVLVVSSMVVSQYVLASKLFIENRMPENDDWTESLANQHNWTSNGFISLDGTNYKMGNTDGNHSIVSSISNEASIWIKLTGVDPINCSETSYSELFFWINWTNGEGLSPNSVTLKLFSDNEDSYFETDITRFLASSGEWTNATLNAGTNQGWASNNSPNWQSITGMEFNMNWSASKNLIMKIDGLFFRKFSSPTSSEDFGALIPSIILQVTLTFAINWILWSGFLIIVGKLFQEDLGRWNVFFIIMGHAFIATVVYTLLGNVPLATLPPLNVPLDSAAASALLNEVWVPLPAYQLWLYLPLIGEVWIAALGAVVVRLKRETTWGKAATVAVVAFGIRFLLRLLLGV